METEETKSNKSNQNCTRKWTLPKSAPESVSESPVECRNLRDHVDVSHLSAFLEGCTLTHTVAHSYSSSSSNFVLVWLAL